MKRIIEKKNTSKTEVLASITVNNCPEKWSELTDIISRQPADVQAYCLATFFHGFSVRLQSAINPVRKSKDGKVKLVEPPIDTKSQSNWDFPAIISKMSEKQRKPGKAARRDELLEKLATETDVEAIKAISLELANLI